MMFGLGPMEIGVIVIIALMLFGPARIPKVMRGIADGLKEFRKAGKEISDEND